MVHVMTLHKLYNLNFASKVFYSSLIDAENATKKYYKYYLDHYTLNQANL